MKGLYETSMDHASWQKYCDYHYILRPSHNQILQSMVCYIPSLSDYFQYFIFKAAHEH